MKLLKKPYTRAQLDEFITECNNDGKIRVERHIDGAYGLYAYEIYQDGEVIDLRGTEEYEAEQAAIAKEQRKIEIETEMETIDKKRIRAICEPQAVREDGSTWLEYYNEYILALREELASL